MIRKLFSALILAALPITVAEAAPVLRAEVTVRAPVVTVADMFDDAGSLAEQPLFRAPEPGTSGIVSVEAVRQAAALIGLTQFSSDGVLRVRVARAAALIDEAALTALIVGDLKARGIVTPIISAQTTFDQHPLNFNAEAVEQPVALAGLRYMPGSGVFVARFLLAGRDAPLDLSGRIELMVEAPHLVTTLRAGAVLTEADVQMKLVPLRYAESAGYAEPDQIIGKALVRQSRAGTVLKSSDVTEPQVVNRNEPVTIFFRSGALTLSAKGQALSGAAKGDMVQVLNLVSRKVLTAVAVSTGAVEIVTTPKDVNVAGL